MLSVNQVLTASSRAPQVYGLMFWTWMLDSGGRADSGLTPCRTGQYRESPVGSPDCMIFWPCADITNSTNFSASSCSALGALESMPRALGNAVTGSRNLTLISPWVLRPAPMPAELWINASLM